LTWSPMDTGILLRSHKLGKNDDSNLEEVMKKNREIVDEMAKTKPLPETDRWRRTLYYFSLSPDIFKDTPSTTNSSLLT